MRSIPGFLLSLAVAVVLVFLGVTAFREGTEAAGTVPERLCGPEVRLTNIPGNLDVTINGVIHERPFPAVDRWSVVFEDPDGIFTVSFSNSFGDFGSTDYDIGPQQDCETTTTTTTTSTTTTTIPENDVFVGAVGTTCQADIPVITITFGNREELNGHVGTLTFIDVNGDVIDVRPITYQAGGQQVELYPGAAVDANGEPIDWPGWVMNEFGFWVEDPSDAHWRLGLTLRVEINPTAETQISYPPATETCANPENPPGPPVILPPAR